MPTEPQIDASKVQWDAEPKIDASKVQWDEPAAGDEDLEAQGRKEGLAGDIAAGLVGARNMINPWAADMAAWAHGKTKEQQVAEDEARAAKHPLSYYGGAGAGLAATALVPGLPEVRGAGLAARAANNPLVRDALLGAAYGSGEGEGIEERAKNALTGAGVGAGAGKLLRGAGQMAEGLLKGAKGAGEAASQAERIGVDLPSYTAGEGPTTKILGKGLTTMPGGAGPINKATQQATEQLEQAVGGLGRGVTKPMAGTAAELGLNDAVQGILPRRITRAYQDLESVVPSTSEAALDATRRAVDDIVSRRTRARLPSAQSPATRLVEDALANPNPMDFAGMKDLRSSIGKRIDNLWREPGDLDAGELNQIYGALTKDLEMAATKAGGSNGMRAFRNANSITQNARRDMRNLTKIIGKREGDVGPEKILDRIHGLATAGSRADANRLLLAKRSMSPQAWEDVSSGIINQLGVGRSGDFSFNTFATNFGKLSDHGKNALFGPANAATRRHIEDIAAVSQRLKNAEQFRNTSNTATAVHVGAFLSELMLNPLFALGQVGGANILSRVMASPRTAKYAAGLAKAVERAANTPEALAGRPLNNNPAVISAFNAYRNAVQEDNPTEQREQRASGGKVDKRDYPAKRLTLAAKRALREIQNDSKQLMEVPDEHMAAALHRVKE